MRYKYMCVLLLLFTIFVPKVYAFTYDIEAKADNNKVTEGAVKEIKVSLKEVHGVASGFGACSLKIEFDSTIVLNGTVKGLSTWTVMPGNDSVYSFDTGDSFVSNSEMFVIPVRVNNAGWVKLTNIECSDGDTKVSVSDKEISFTIQENTTTNNNVTNNDVADTKEDNTTADNDFVSANISEIILSEGSIDFSPEITEYTVTVSDFNSLEVSVNLESSSSTYTIDKNDIDGDKTVSILVMASDESSKIYTINVIEESDLNEEDSSSEKNNYAPIFIGIICILVFINVFRIVRNIKK